MFGRGKHQGVVFAAGGDGGHSTDGAEDTRSRQAEEFCNTQHRVLTSSHPGIQRCLCCRDLQGGAEILIPSPRMAGANPRHTSLASLGDRSSNLEAKDQLILEGRAQN